MIRLALAVPYKMVPTDPQPAAVRPSNSGASNRSRSNASRCKGPNSCRSTNGSEIAGFATPREVPTARRNTFEPLEKLGILRLDAALRRSSTTRSSRRVSAIGRVLSSEHAR